ncbi:AmmeMemoRadiSam system protein B, partial [Candidatus Kaiserbacteria bacterium RIFCSPHIGHO2_01_FULL_48_10]
STVASIEKPKTIILIGPNHNNRGNAVLSSVRPWGTPFGTVEPDTAVVESLHSSSVVSLWGDGFEEEHSIGAIVPFIKYYFPNARLVPIVIRSDIGRVDAERLGKSLAALISDESVLLLASIDFSHYQPRAEAEANDRETWKAITSFDLSRLSTFGNDHLDAPWTLVAFLAALKEQEIFRMKLLQNTNSGALTNDDKLLTTSYFTVLFGK